MIWGYVDCLGGVIHSTKRSDFSLENIDDLEDFPEVFSIRFTTDGDEYVIDMKTENAEKKVWGQRSDIDVRVSCIDTIVTNVTNGLSEKGAGFGYFYRKCHQKGMARPCWKTHKDISKPIQSSTFRDKNVLSFDDNACLNEALTGGKGSSLAFLFSLTKETEDFSVPKGFCITSTVFEQHVRHSKSISDLIENIEANLRLQNFSEMRKECDSLADKFIESDLSDELQRSIDEILISLFDDDYENLKLAVRSSALGEDGEEISGAGQMETILGCKYSQIICIKIRRVTMSSLWLL